MNQPSEAKVLFLTMKPFKSRNYPDGAGLTTSGGVIIYSTAYRLLSVLFWIVIIIHFIHSYLTLKPFKPTNRILLAKKLWILSFSIFLIWLVPNSFGWFELTPILVIIAVLLIAYITIFIPDGLLATHSQILRVSTLFQKIKEGEVKTKSRSAVGYKYIIEYLDSLPPEIFEE